MTNAALQSLRDALAATRAFLLPVSVPRWVRLSVVVAFVGTPAVVAPPFDVTWHVEGPAVHGLGGVSTVAGDVALTDSTLAVLGLLVGAVLLVGLAVAFVASVMEFVFVESLRRDDVRVRAYWARHWQRGARLLAFRVALWVAVLALAVPLVVAAALWLLQGPVTVAAALLLALVAVPAFLVGATAAALVDAFTTAFVVPVVLVADCGILDGWRRLRGPLRAEWPTVGLYALLSFLVGGLLAAALVTLVGLVGLLLAVPAALVGVAAVALLGVSPVAGVVVLVLAATVVAAVVAVAALAAVPLKTYLRFYALFVLGDVAPAYDPVRDARAFVRGGRATHAG